MKRYLISGTSLCVILHAFLFGTGGSAWSASELLIDDRIHDFGVVYREEHPVVDHTFVLMNVGDEPLIINGVEPSCGCTRADLSRRRIPPGEVAELATELKVRNRGGKEQIRVTVTSTDPVNPVIDLGLVGYVLERWTLTPLDFYLGNVTAEKPSEGFRIEIRSQQRLDEVPCPPPAPDPQCESVTVSFVETSEREVDGRYRETVYTYDLVVNPGSLVRDFVECHVDFRAEGPEHVELHAKVSWTVEKDLTVFPRTLHLVKGRSFEPAGADQPLLPGVEFLPRSMGRIHIQSRSGAPFEILSATVGEPFHAEWRKGQTTAASVEVAVREASPGTHESILRIETDRPNEKTFEALLTAEVEPPAPILSSPGNFEHFGLVFRDEVPQASHVFILQNSGTANLSLELVSSTADETSLDAKELGPGETTILTLVHDLLGRTGRVEATAAVRTNDPNSATEVFRLGGHVLTRWEIKPEELDFGFVSQGEEKNRLVTVIQRFHGWEEPLLIDDFETEDQTVRIEAGEPVLTYSDLGIATAETPLSVQLRFDSNPGRHHREISLGSDEDPQRNPPSIPLQWRMMGDIQSQPRRLVLLSYGEDNGRAAAKRMKVYSRQKRPFEVLSVSAPEGFELLEIEKRDSEFIYEIQGPPGEAAGSGSQFIVFHTDREDQPEVRVEVLKTSIPD